MPVSGEFADWATELTLRHIPVTVRRATNRRILTAIAGGVGAARVGTVDSAVHVAVGIGGPPEAELIGHAAGRLGAPAAALANGMLIGATRGGLGSGAGSGSGFGSGPGFGAGAGPGFGSGAGVEPDGAGAAMAVVLPAALAVGQEVKARGDEVLVAVIAGHEMACRLAGSAGSRSVGVLGATLAAARLMTLDRSRIRDAVGIAGEFVGIPMGAGGGLGVAEGVAAGNAIIAARLAASGASGPPGGIDELCRTGHLRPEAVLDGLAGLDGEWACEAPLTPELTDYQFDLETCDRLGGTRRDARALVAEIRALAFAPSLDSILALTVKVAAGT
ncbi:MmgE/PrpD family protein [Embleya sp. AB8]|uniref:MmgE/PrpD family protein n=1 Tax=Embleya sp. AB8 TaxID=3156304 RepID=UPI003C70E9F0